MKVECGALLSVCQACVGSPGYAAPEVIQGRPYNQRVDMFSSGCLWPLASKEGVLDTVRYFMLFGKCPFNGKSQKAKKMKKVFEDLQEILDQTVLADVKYPRKDAGG